MCIMHIVLPVWVTVDTSCHVYFYSSVATRRVEDEKALLEKGCVLICALQNFVLVYFLSHGVLKDTCTGK